MDVLKQTACSLIEEYAEDSRPLTIVLNGTMEWRVWSDWSEDNFKGHTDDHSTPFKFPSIKPTVHNEYSPFRRPEKMTNVEKDQLVAEDGQPKLITTSPSTNRQTVRKPSFHDIWNQVLASTIALSAVIQAGINLSFSGVLIPQLFEDPHIKDQFTKVEASWIASLAVIAQPFGSFAAGPLIDTFGRKAMCVVQCLPMILGWVITYFTTDSLWPLYLARVLAGFGSGLTLVGLVYTAEISHHSYRAMLLSMNSVHVALGILITTVVGVYLDWHTCAIIFGLLSTGSALLAFIIPESPYWLAVFTYTPQEDIKLIIRKLNKNNEAYLEEWERIQEAVSKRRLNTESDEENQNWCQKFLGTFKSFKDRSSYIPFLILVCLFLLQQTSGTYVVIFYTVNIFQSVGGNLGFGFDAYSATVALGILRFVLSLVAAGISRVLGRRPIMLISSIGMAVSAGLAAGLTYTNHIYTINFSGNVTGNSTAGVVGTGAVSDWWIMLSILLYVSAGSIGLMVIPWTLIGELLPIRVRAFGSGLMVAYGYLLLFVIIKTFPFLVDLITFPIVLVSYAAMSAVCATFVYFCLPETLGKSFKEIEKYFERQHTTGPS